MALAWRAGGAACRSSADESPARASVSPSGAGGGRSSASHRQHRVGLNARLRAACEHARRSSKPGPATAEAPSRPDSPPGPGSGEELRRRLAAACVPWAVGLKRHVQLRRERRLRQAESPTIGSHQAHGCRPPCRLAASDQLSRSTGRALRSLCRSPTACRQVSASAREPSGPTDWSARSKPRAWSSRTSASSANRAAADLRASSTVGDDAGSLAMTVTPCRRWR